MFNSQQLKLKGRKPAFTLVEILVAMTLAVLILGALYSIYVTSHKSYRRSVNRAELNQNARIALERIARDLRQTERIVTSLPPDDTDILNPAPSLIQFQDGHDTTKIQYIKYLLSGSELHRQLIHYCFSSHPENCAVSDWVAWNAQDRFGDPPSEWIDPNNDVVKADKLSSLKFYGDRLITIELKVENSDQNNTYKTEVLGRNIQ